MSLTETATSPPREGEPLGTSFEGRMAKTEAWRLTSPKRLPTCVTRTMLPPCQAFHSPCSHLRIQLASRSTKVASRPQREHRIKHSAWFDQMCLLPSFLPWLFSWVAGWLTQTIFLLNWSINNSLAGCIRGVCVCLFV